MRGEAAQKAPCPAQADSCQSGQSFLSSRPQGFPTLSMLVPNCCGGYQGNHFLYLRSPHGKAAERLRCGLSRSDPEREAQRALLKTLAGGWEQVRCPRMGPGIQTCIPECGVGGGRQGQGEG